jgi:hypothetical protein
MVTRHSGLQKEVFSLYRKILRVATAKDRAVHSGWSKSQHSFPMLRNNQTTSTYYACQAFRRETTQVKRNDFKRIEHMIRKGHKHLKVLQMPGVQHFGAPQLHAP